MSQLKLALAIVAAAVLLVGCVKIVPTTSNTNSTNSSSVPEESSSYVASSSEQSISTLAQVIAAGTGLSESESEEISATMLEIGINDIRDIKPLIGQGVDKLQSFEGIANDMPNHDTFTFTIENRKLIYVHYWNTDLFTDADGVLTTMQNVLYHLGRA